MAGPSEMQTPAEQSGRHGTEIGPQNSPATQATMGETVDGGRSKPLGEPEVQVPTQQSAKRKREEERLRKARHLKLDLNKPPEEYGVSARGHGWVAYLWVPGVCIPGREKRGKKITLGYFEEKVHAMAIRDMITLKLEETHTSKAELNFPDNGNFKKFLEDHATWDLWDVVWDCRHEREKSMTGVTCYLTERQKMVYVARISHTYEEPVKEKQTHELGTFASPDEAGRAYDLALLFIHKNHTYWEKLRLMTNFRPSKYSEDEILEAGITHGLREARTLALTEAESNQDIN